ncbi:hypothetical protein LXA43DRAFT_1102020 [Ganoderma leucocontextum]|nr:hypothetical protein LXA43DRAFT_1102020 [Ganoderma leucocontextum]
MFKTNSLGSATISRTTVGFFLKGSGDLHGTQRANSMRSSRTSTSPTALDAPGSTCATLTGAPSSYVSGNQSLVQIMCRVLDLKAENVSPNVSLIADGHDLLSTARRTP